VDLQFTNTSGERIGLLLLIRSLDERITTNIDNIPDAKDHLLKALQTEPNVHILDIVGDGIIVALNNRTLHLTLSVERKKVEVKSILLDITPTSHAGQFGQLAWLDIMKLIEERNTNSEQTKLYQTGVLDTLFHLKEINHIQHAYWCHKLCI